MVSVFLFTGRLSGGGSERVSAVLANYLVSQEVATTVVTIGSVTDKDYRLDNRVQRLCLSDVNGSSVTRRLIKIIRKYKPDVIVSMAVPISLYSIPAAIATRTKIIVSERTDPKHSAAKKMTLWYSRFLLNFVDGFVFQTKDAKVFYNSKIQKRSVIIGNPLRDDLPQPYRGERNKEIVTAGRLVPLKNHKMLIESFKEIHEKHPDYKLVIYGDGPSRKDLEQLIQSLGLADTVSLPGFVLDLNQRIRISSIFAFTSDYEGLPNSVLEAMGLGLPVVATDCPCGGVSSLITHEYNGLLIKVGDTKALTESLFRIIEDNELACRLGLKAEDVRMMYAESAICSQWYEFITKVATRK